MAMLDCWPDERREVRDPATGARIVQLTCFSAHHIHLFEAASPITPTGDDLLFVSNRSGSPCPQLFRLELATGAIHQVTDINFLSPECITPAANGRQAIAAVSGEEGEVVAIDLEIGDTETLAVFLEAKLDGCHLSAAGEYVATIVRRSNEATITAVHTQGMRTVPVQEDRRPLAAARFSPDSKNTLLYLAAPDSLCCIEFDGSADRVVYSGVQAFRRSEVQAFRGSGNQVFRGHHCEAEVSGVQGGQTPGPERPNSRTPERLNACLPTWLGSGEEILLIPGPSPGPLLAVPRTGGSPRIVSSQPCVWARSDSSGRRIVAVVRPEADEARECSGEGVGEMVLIDPQMDSSRPLVSRIALDAKPCFSPDGRSVVYSSRDAEGCSQLFWIETD